jgi:hypothetical protein
MPNTVRDIYAKKKIRKLNRQNPLKTLVNIISPFIFQCITTNIIAITSKSSRIRPKNDLPQMVINKKWTATIKRIVE